MTSVASKRALALLSGGLDSSVAAAMAKEEGWEIVQVLNIHYGQRAAAEERRAAKRIAEQLNAPFLSLSLPFFSQFSRGGLLDAECRLPQPKTENLDDREFTQKSADAVWVPNRNGILIEVAAGVAEDIEAHAVIVGFNKEEAATFPDNSEAYLRALNHALEYSTRGQVRVISPTENLTKSEIVATATRLSFPLQLLWSCYESGERMCGRCESCMRLKRALNSQGVDGHEWFESSLL